MGQMLQIGDGEQSSQMKLGEKMDMSTIKHFEERDYMEALDYIGVFKQS